MTGINPFTYKFWLVVPAGAICLGMLAASGAILGARYFHIIPTIIDATLMVLVGATTMLLIYYLDYATFVLSDGRKAMDLIDFPSYVDLILTKAHMRVGRGAVDTGEVGQLGYALAGIEFVGFLLGGAATFFFIKGLWRCADCSSYLRKLKTKKTKELTYDEAIKVIELFHNGDLVTIQQLLVWTPQDRTLGRKEQKALVTFDLHGCPSCKTEVVAARVNAFNGKEWSEVPALTTRRNLMAGTSLRDRFA